MSVTVCFAVLTACYVTAFAYYGIDSAHCHIPERSLYPFVCLSVCLSVTITLYVWRAACRIAMSETAHDFTINDADRDSA